MARPIKRGLDYFQTDTALFTDRKIRKLVKNHGAQAYAVFAYLLCEIYKDNGYYVLFNNDLVFDVADTLHLPENEVEKIIMFCTTNTLFDNRLFSLYGILTSHGIQHRYMLAKSRKPDYFDPRFLLVSPEKTVSGNSRQKKTGEAPKAYPVKQLQQRLKTLEWIDDKSIHTLNTNNEELKKCFDIFCQHQLVIGNEPRTEQDFKAHFINWLKLRQTQHQQSMPQSKLEHNTVILKKILNEIENGAVV